MTPKDQSRHNNLIALGSAAVIAVYATGFAHTRAAAAAADDAPTQAQANPAPAVRGPDSSDTPTHAEATTPKAVAAAPGVSTAAAAAGSSSATPASASPSAPAATAAVSVPPPAATDSTRGAPAPVVTDTQPKSGMPVERYKDGFYKGSGTSRHGDVQVGVRIVDGRIVDAYITICATEYTCDVISMLPDQVMQRQSARVDRVSGATDSAQAFTKAVTDALSMAK